VPLRLIPEVLDPFDVPAAVGHQLRVVVDPLMLIPSTDNVSYPDQESEYTTPSGVARRRTIGTKVACPQSAIIWA
jgi:hypothetical protein